MKITICILFLFISFSSLSQMKSEIKKIEKILGKDFTRSEAEDYYLKSYSQELKADTSLVMKYDTTGIYLNNEYLMFRNPLTYDKRKESFKFIKQKPVTVKEYNEFIDWVRDSIAREKLFYGLKNNAEAHQFLIEHKSECSAQCIASREEARKKYPFNWEVNIDYNNPNYVPILADMYLPQSERLYRQKEFDDRKLTYSYNELFPEYPTLFISELRNNSNTKISQFGYANIILPTDEFPRFNENHINITPEYPLLASNEYLLYTEASVISKVYNNQFIESPIYGLLGTQASAYCYWIENKINSELSNLGMDFAVKVTLPPANDVFSRSTENISVPEFDYTEIWKITAEDYQAFSNYVRDSIIKENLYDPLGNWNLEDSDAEKLINYHVNFFDESTLEWLNYDPSDRLFHRDVFYFNQKINLKKFCEDISFGNWIDTITLDFDPKWFDNTIPFYDYLINKANRSGLNYVYYLEDIGTKGIRGKFIYEENNGEYILDFDDQNTTYEPLKGYDNRQGHEEYPSIAGQDLVLGGWISDLGTDLSVRRHENLQRFIHRNITSVKVDHLESYKSNKLLENITYEQAMAFYSWKYPRWKMNSPEDNWQQFVFPTKEQFERIQRGEAIIIPGHSIEYPTPLFRYVVHFFEK